MRLSFIAFLILGFSVTSFAATYEVPGFEQGAGTYEMNFRLRVKGSVYRAKYDLPLDLTGVENEIDATGRMDAEGILVLKGENALLKCSMEQKMCHAEYSNLVIDPVKVKERLEAQGLSADQVQLRLSVTDQFGGEPIGVIYFD